MGTAERAELGSKTTSIYIRVTPEQKRRLRAEARKRGLSLSKFVRCITLSEAYGRLADNR